MTPLIAARLNESKVGIIQFVPQIFDKIIDTLIVLMRVAHYGFSCAGTSFKWSKSLL
jgi:hypothetical protein